MTKTIMDQENLVSENNPTRFTKNDLIPPEFWGKDHWTTLAYVESVMTDCGGFQLGADSRMRTNRRNFRVMSEFPTPKRSGSETFGATGFYPSQSPTRLNNDTDVEGHDDWNCLEDMAAIGLFDVSGLHLEPKKVIHLSLTGQKVSAALRAHKQAGNSFSTFSLSAVEDLHPDDLREPDGEVFNFGKMTFDVSGILKAINDGSLKPTKDTFDAEFIDHFGKQVLALNREQPEKRHFSILAGIDHEKMNAMPEHVLKKPVLLAYAGKNKGYLNIDGQGANYLLIDGCHRMGKAYMTRVNEMDVYILSAAQVRKFKN